MEVERQTHGALNLTVCRRAVVECDARYDASPLKLARQLGAA